MKSKIFFILFLISTKCFSQTTVDTLAPIKLTEVINVDSASKDELFSRAEKWFSIAFGDSKEVINISDKQNGIISGKAIIKYNSSVFNASELTKGYINFEISISVKDGRYKYELTNFTHNGNGIDFGIITPQIICPVKIPNTFPSWRDKVWLDLKTVSSTNAISLAESIKKGMVTKTEAQKSDW